MTLLEVLDRLRIASKGVGEHHHATPGRRQIDCPMCSPHSGRFRMGVHERTLKASRWSCGSHPLRRVLREASGESASLVASLVGELDSFAPADDKPSGSYQVPAGVGPLLPAHRDYLARRGYDPDQLAAEWRLGGIGPAAHLGWRVFIPVLWRGRPASWTTRALGERVPLRYLSARPDQGSTPLKHTVYGAEKATHTLVVVEGLFDVYRIGPGAGATYGLEYTPEQVAVIARFPRRVICFDSEPVAQRQARKLASELAPLPGLTILVTLSGKDPDSSPADEIAELRKRYLD